MMDEYLFRVLLTGGIWFFKLTFYLAWLTWLGLLFYLIHKP